MKFKVVAIFTEPVRSGFVFSALDNDFLHWRIDDYDQILVKISSVFDPNKFSTIYSCYSGMKNFKIYRNVEIDDTIFVYIKSLDKETRTLGMKMLINHFIKE